MTRLGRACTHGWYRHWNYCTLLQGTLRVSALLNATAIDLVDGGKQEIFTPSFMQEYYCLLFSILPY